MKLYISSLSGSFTNPLSDTLLLLLPEVQLAFPAPDYFVFFFFLNNDSELSINHYVST